MITQTEQSLSTMTPEKALNLLKEGNNRFVDGQNDDRNLLKQVETTSGGQYPFAVILGCVDSRVPHELIFDLGIGDVFSVRIAGNHINEDILGSMEFACHVVGSKHILVLGHTSCGAIQGAAGKVELGHLTQLLDKLQPAVSAAGSEATVDQIAAANVKLTVEEIKAQSPTLRALVESGDLSISGAMYDVSSGQVTFDIA